MASDILESDWREFKKVRSELLQRYCKQVLAELADIANATNGTAHERYLRAYKLLQDRDDDLARAFNDFRRSTAVMQLTVMRQLGLLTDDDLTGFSPALQTRVREVPAIFSSKRRTSI